MYFHLSEQNFHNSQKIQEKVQKIFVSDDQPKTIDSAQLKIVHKLRVKFNYQQLEQILLGIQIIISRSENTSYNKTLGKKKKKNTHAIQFFSKAFLNLCSKILKQYVLQERNVKKSSLGLSSFVFSITQSITL